MSTASTQTRGGESVRSPGQSNVVAVEEPHRGEHQSQYWIVTLNNPGREVDYYWNALPQTRKFLVGQLERGQQGTEHLQLAVGFNRTVRRSRIKAAFDNRAHCARKYGRSTVQQLVAYCTKEETRVAGPYTFGTVPENSGEARESSRTSKAVLVKRKIDEGTQYMEIARQDEQLFGTILKNHSGFKSYEQYQRMQSVQDRQYMPFLLVLYGVAGAGKSHLAQEFVSSIGQGRAYQPSISDSNRRFPWFDGYNGSDAVIFNEFDSDKVDCGVLCNLVDRYYYRAEVKGGSVLCTPNIVILTSNIAFGSWYANSVQAPAFRRRVSTVIHFIRRETENYMVYHKCLLEELLQVYASSEAGLASGYQYNRVTDNVMRIEDFGRNFTWTDYVDGAVRRSVRPVGSQNQFPCNQEGLRDLDITQID